MIIKHTISFKLRPYKSARFGTMYQIQLHITFGGYRWVTSTGCLLVDEKAWDSQAQMVKSGYVGPKGETAAEINSTLSNCKEQLETAVKYFEVNDTFPTVEQLADKYNERMNRKRPAVEKKDAAPAQPGFFEVFDMFVENSGEKNAWTPATFQKMAALKADLLACDEGMSFESLDDNGLTKFVIYLRDEKVLKTPRKKKEERTEYDAEDLIGIKNSTIGKKMGYLRWFLNWATDKGYNTNRSYKTFRPTLKTTQKKVIYLTEEELCRVRDLDLTGENEYLDPVRDVFIFCCFSGLRHSDVSNLRRSDIKSDHIEVTTVKTDDSLSIELNEATKAILKKYKKIQFKKNLALPRYTNQAMNRDLKELCRLAGVEEEIRITTYKGNERMDIVKPKWQLVGTHTGRRTFIVHALSHGTPPNVVMKWTGHNDYKSMKPYIDIVDSIKAKEMKKFDQLYKKK